MAIDQAWIEAAEAQGTSAEAVLDAFDALPAFAPEAFTGRWSGAEIATGHPLDGVLTAYGWYGKEVRDSESVLPLLFRHGSEGIVAVDPKWLDPGLAAHMPMRRTGAMAAAFRAGKHLIQNDKPTARLREVLHRGVVSATIIYDHQPINDVFRSVTPDLLLGLMDCRGLPPYFFTLRREPG